MYCEVSIIPSNVWGYYYNSDNRFEMLNGEKDISLGKNQIIINETFYNSIKNNKEKNGKIYVGIPMRIKKGRTITQEFEVVGVCKDSDKGMVHKNDDGSIEGYVKAFVSIISFEESELTSDYKNVIIYSKNIQKVSELADEMHSSFSNAMNERKFEIGVRRAIGASKKSIMLQFLIEGFTVMLINLLLSIMICVFFIITFSILFAFMSTRVEIVDYLKNEG